MKTFKTAAIAMAAATGGLVANPGAAWAQYGQGRDWGCFPMMGFGGGWWGMIMGIAFWALIIIGLIFLIRWLVQNTGQRKESASHSPLDILKQRYARGEISKEEYQNMRRDLES